MLVVDSALMHKKVHKTAPEILFGDILLTLYIHIPWCVKKCPYCDFNSHKKDGADFSEGNYLQALKADLIEKLPLIWGRKIHAVFIGGGTPSLLSPNFYEKLFAEIRALLSFDSNIEITMEANPGAVEHGSFEGYKKAGINRISLGVQSFNSEKLHKLGRIHDNKDVVAAVKSIKTAGFENFNLDLMYGLPGQSVEEAISDLEQAMALQPTHISWYQLTIEPNTVFYRTKPILPVDVDIIKIEELGRSLLGDNDYIRYEISAYSKAGCQCQHNLNYWNFGDYLGIGAGAHSKITDRGAGVVTRYQQFKMPKKYIGEHLRARPQELQLFKIKGRELSQNDLIFEFFLNKFRLESSCSGFCMSEFEESAGLSADLLDDILQEACSKGFIEMRGNRILKTSLGDKFLDDLIELFLLD